MATLLSPRRFIPSLRHLTPSRSKIRVRDLSFTFRVTTRSLTQLGSSSMSRSTTESELNHKTMKRKQRIQTRRDLIDTWPMGSVVTQGCHASVSSIWSHKEDPHTLQYCSPENIDSMHKVTLEVKGEPQILNLSEKLKAGGIAHKLWIEQPENIPTCLATKPYPKSVVALYFKKLKLCK
uniref:peptidyl-tRNA hydrolase n=1 Tax=Salix viminalis TaxID=40686 RepID=A0A6N2KM11_SALVM